MHDTEFRDFIKSRPVSANTTAMSFNKGNHKIINTEKLEKYQSIIK